VLKVKYNHPASPRDGIELNKIYLVNKDSKGYYISNEDFKLYMQLDLLKSLFKVVEGKFEEPKKKFHSKNFNREVGD